MRRFFTIKLALSNLKKNKKFYLPYMIASIIMISIFYIMGFIADNKGLDNFRGTEYIKTLLTLGTWVVAIFAIIFVFYINSFLMKQRSKEFGVYNILGMEKRHLAKVLCAESIFTSTGSILSGIGVGILFSRLSLMIMGKILGLGKPINSDISVSSIRDTIVLFSVLFVAILIKNMVSISLSKPIEMLKGASEPEREPKAKWMLSLIGAAFMIAGYVISITIKKPLAAIFLFFVAVVLVIIGTYLLFTTVSISILKLLKKNKKVYYKKNNFTTISGMLFRMKQNAVGMANICILSTMVIILISMTVSMKVGVNSVIRKITPTDVVIGMDIGVTKDGNIAFTSISSEQIDNELKLFTEEMGKSNYEFSTKTAYLSHEFEVSYDNASKSMKLQAEGTNQHMKLMTAQQYERYSGKKLDIGKNEAVSVGTELEDEIKIGDVPISVKQEDIEAPPTNISPIVDEFMLIVRDDETANKFVEQGKVNGGFRGAQLNINANFKNNASPEYELFDEAAMKYMNGREDGLSLGSRRVTTRSELLTVFGSLTNGFLFLCTFLGIIFTFAAALIVYYKQISEGYYDKDKFEIMQKVGMSEKEVKKTIRKQVMIVFFAPLLMAICHVAGAFNMVRLMLLIFSIDNTLLMIECTALTVIGFAVIYGAVFILTAKEYYRIVRRKI